jgi:hypothetical protein
MEPSLKGKTQYSYPLVKIGCIVKKNNIVSVLTAVDLK